MLQIIHSNGMIEPFVTKDKFPTLDELQTAVGGYIESVPTKDERMMMINEDGKMKKLTFNFAATKLASLFEGDFIVGNAIIGTSEEFGE